MAAAQRSAASALQEDGHVGQARRREQTWQ
jgi:hypothetical protein